MTKTLICYFNIRLSGYLPDIRPNPSLYRQLCKHKQIVIWLYTDNTVSCGISLLNKSGKKPTTHQL